MPSTIFSGSLNPTTDITIHTVGTISFSGVYLFQTDIGQLRNGDEIELRVNTTVGSGTIGCIYLASYAHQQSVSIKASPPFVIENTGQVSITKRAGASTRWFNYSIINI